MTTIKIQIDVADHLAQQLMEQLRQVVSGQGGHLTVAAERKGPAPEPREALARMQAQGRGLTDADIEDWNRLQEEEDRRWEETYKQRYGVERPAVQDL